MIVTHWLEQDLSKRRILALYLNVIEWGDGIYGCEAAARSYHDKSASELTVHEAAGLVAMIPNPRRINPQVNPARHARAQRRVLGEPVEHLIGHALALVHRDHLLEQRARQDVPAAQRDGALDDQRDGDDGSQEQRPDGPSRCLNDCEQPFFLYLFLCMDAAGDFTESAAARQVSAVHQRDPV